MDTADLESRFTYHPPKDGQPETYHLVRECALAFAELINEKAPDGREKSLAITALEESVMWANAAIARHG